MGASPSETAKGRSAARAIPTEYVLAAVGLLTWASAFPGIRVGLRSYSPQSVALLRYLTASLVLAIMAPLVRIPRLAWRDVPGVAGLGMAGIAIYNVALNAGEQHVTAAVASLIVASSPILMAIAGVAILRERLAPSGWAGILLGFVGIAVVSLTANASLELSPWVIPVWLAAVVQTIYSMGQKRYLSKYGALAFTTYAIWFGTLFLLVFAPGLARELPSATTESTLAVVYMGIFPGALGYVCWAGVLKRVPASVAGSFLYLVPVLAMVIAWLWLGEVPGLSAFLGGALVIGGVVIVNRQRPRA